MRATRWDAILLARAAAVAVLALAVVWLITAASDEGSVGWGIRAGRTLPLTPLCAAIGVWGALTPIRARGEARALEALGRSPGQIAAAAVAGGAVVALVAALIMASVPAVDVSGFYPTATHEAAWQWREGGFEDRAQGLRVGANGAPEIIAPTDRMPSSPVMPRRGRVAAALATALSALALSALAARAIVGVRREGRHRSFRTIMRQSAGDLAASGLAAAATVALFQAAAAHRAPALASVLPPLILLAHAARRYGALR